MPNRLDLLCEMDFVISKNNFRLKEVDLFYTIDYHRSATVRRSSISLHSASESLFKCE